MVLQLWPTQRSGFERQQYLLQQYVLRRAGTRYIAVCCILPGTLRSRKLPRGFASLFAFSLHHNMYNYDSRRLLLRTDDHFSFCVSSCLLLRVLLEYQVNGYLVPGTLYDAATRAICW